METSLQDLLTKLQAQGMRMTPKRRAMLRLLFAEAGKHFSAQEIYEILERQFPAITLATIYNNLHALEEAHAVSSLGFPGQSDTLYEIEHGPHVNLICESCGRIVDLPMKDLQDMHRKAEARSAYQIKHTTVEMFGLCPDCQT